MNFEDMLKESFTHRRGVYEPLLRWQDDLSQYRRQFLGEWTYEEDNSSEDEVVWNVERNEPVWHKHLGRSAKFFFTDEMHTCEDLSKEISMSFEEAMGFGGSNGK